MFSTKFSTKWSKLFLSSLMVSQNWITTYINLHKSLSRQRLTSIICQSTQYDTVVLGNYNQKYAELPFWGITQTQTCVHVHIKRKFHKHKRHYKASKPPVTIFHIFDLLCIKNNQQSHKVINTKNKKYIT